MHDAARSWVQEQISEMQPSGAVLEIGSRYINGEVRDLFGADYTGLDIAPGDGVDIVADAATWQPDRQYGVAVCCDTFEHTPEWPAICSTMFSALDNDGIAIFTMAGAGWPPHSAIDGAHLRPGEHYENIETGPLYGVLARLGFHDIKMSVTGNALFAAARR